jgi:hypothetical protein
MILSKEHELGQIFLHFVEPCLQIFGVLQWAHFLTI